MAQSTTASRRLLTLLQPKQAERLFDWGALVFIHIA